MAVFAGIGVLGIMVGVAGTADNGHRATAQREISADGEGRQNDMAKWTTSEPNGGATPAQQADIAQDAARASADAMVPTASTEVPSSVFSPPVITDRPALRRHGGVPPALPSHRDRSTGSGRPPGAWFHSHTTR